MEASLSGNISTFFNAMKSISVYMLHVRLVHFSMKFARIVFFVFVATISSLGSLGCKSKKAKTTETTAATGGSTPNGQAPTLIGDDKDIAEYKKLNQNSLATA